jgi:hypothetical protein
VTTISVGAYHDLAIRQNGSVISWDCGCITIGDHGFPNDYGQCTSQPRQRRT